MERTVPSTASEEVELYLRTFYSLLRSTAEVQIRTLEEAHAGMRSLLHSGVRDEKPDMSAFIYGLLRLPPAINDASVVVLGQSADVFGRSGFDVLSWEETSAPARRRRCFYDGADTLACIIASRSDIDDMIPILTAYQIEWNKLHRLLQQLPGDFRLAEMCNSAYGCGRLATLLEIPEEDLDRLYAIFDRGLGKFLEKVASKNRLLRVRLLSGSLSEYRRATHSWWDQIEEVAPEVKERPVYFISSNTHSLSNLLGTFPMRLKDELLDYLHESGNAGLLHEWQDIQERRVVSNEYNFFYYVYKKYLDENGDGLMSRQMEYEREHGILRIPSRRYFDVEAQVIDLSRLDLARFDPRLLNGIVGDPAQYLRDSRALILNVDYPLGMAAYNILSEVAENAGKVLGVYSIGKAATLNGVVGDVMIPNVVHDEHSQNTFIFPNALDAADVAPYLLYGTVLDNQKSVTVQGTFLQNERYMDVFYREGYTDIEMEAGPYLSAVYEMFRPVRHPINEIVNLFGVPFDLAIAHYASDTPLSKGKNLGAGSLSYFGMDSTYAVSVALLRRIFSLERDYITRVKRAPAMEYASETGAA